MTTNRDNLITLYSANLKQFRAANAVLTTHGLGTSVPTRADLTTEAVARDRMLELRRLLWPGWKHQ
jgi:molybdopterin-biosynthesis enzyme MoeA-like protein